MKYSSKQKTGMNTIEKIEKNNKEINQKKINIKKNGM